MFWNFSGLPDHVIFGFWKVGMKLLRLVLILTSKGQSPFFGLFLKFGHTIVDAILVQKISNMNM
jgi:hypothetical protein